MAVADPRAFYAELAGLYHLIYPDWEESIRRQGEALDSVIRGEWPGAGTVLDVSCGIGTQALGLAGLGYRVTGSDLSPEAVARAEREAAARGLTIDCSVADMREAHRHHAREFDVVISCDNSVPHLLSDADILLAFRQIYRCTRPGGGCILSVRDYQREDPSRQQVKPYGIREAQGARWLLWQVWDPEGSTYRVTLYLVEDRGGQSCRTLAARASYYPIGIPRLRELLTEAGFERVRRLDGRFFQPLVIGTRPGPRSGRP